MAASLVAQYDGYMPLPGKTVNGKLTLPENMADILGLKIAFKAYRNSLGGKEAPLIDGLSGDQRFFLAYARSWRVKRRDERVLQLLTTDPHAPGQYRTNGAAVHVDGFHAAFGTKPGDQMFKPTPERLHIW
jgi:putative endopeptidase